MNERYKRIFESLKKEPIKKDSKTRRQRILESLKKESSPPEKVITDPNVPSKQEVKSELAVRQKQLLPSYQDTSILKEGYKGIQKVERDIMKTQGKFDMLLKAKNSPALDMYIKVKDKLSKLFSGKESKSIEDLFETQLTNINEFNNRLEVVLRASEGSLSGFQNVRDIESLAIREDYERKAQLEKELPKIQQELASEQEMFRQLPYDSGKYLGQQMKIRNLERELIRLNTRSRIITGSQVHKDSSKVYYTGIEQLLSASVETAGLVLNQSRLVHSTLKNAYPAVKTTIYLWEAIGKAERSLRGLKVHTEEMHRRLSEGVSKMMEIMDAESPGNLLLDSNEGIRYLLDGLERTPDEPEKGYSVIDDIRG